MPASGPTWGKKVKRSRINLRRFWEFSKGYDLILGLNQLQDPASVIKSSRMIYCYLFLIGALGRTSFLAMDQFGRFEKVKKFFGVAHYPNARCRHTVVSDSTLIDRLGRLDIEVLRSINYSMLEALLTSGLILPEAIGDGSSFGKRLYSCLCFATRWGDVFMLDIEPIEKQGKELAASGERLLRRCCDRIGKGRISLLLVDMLYFTEGYWKLREAGYVNNLLVKYTPDTVGKQRHPRWKVLQRFQELLHLYASQSQDKKDQARLHCMGFGHDHGEDSSRKIIYDIYSSANNGFDNRYKIAWITEHKSAKNKEDHLFPFYVITTDKGLDAKQMRSYAHERWMVENDGFKGLNAQVKSKRHWGKNKRVLSNLLLILMVAYSMVTLFMKKHRRKIAKIYHQVKVTIRFVSCVLEQEPFGQLVLQID